MTESQIAIIENNTLIAEFMKKEVRHHYFDSKIIKNKYWFQKPVYEHYEGDKILKEESEIYKQVIGNPSELQYHKSYDWLIPVVEKIASMDWVWINITPCILGRRVKEANCYIEKGVSSTDFKTSKTSTSLIQAIYEAVVEFIIWHNLKK